MDGRGNRRYLVRGPYREAQVSDPCHFVFPVGLSRVRVSEAIPRWAGWSFYLAVALADGLTGWP